MIIKQLTLETLRGLILRLFPGLAGYHYFRYALIEKVHEGSGNDIATNPIMKVDLRLCKHDFALDPSHGVKRNVRLAGASEFIQSPPSKGTYVLLFFPYWLCNAATVISVLYLGRDVNSEEGAFVIRDASRVKISAKTELSFGEGNDRAVLGNELITKLETLIDKTKALGDQILALGAQDSMGSPCLSLSIVTPVVNALKNDLDIVKSCLEDDILSEIKIGMGTDVVDT